MKNRKTICFLISLFCAGLLLGLPSCNWNGFGTKPPKSGVENQAEIDSFLKCAEEKATGAVCNYTAHYREPDVTLNGQITLLSDGEISRYDYRIDRLLPTAEALEAGKSVDTVSGWMYLNGNSARTSEEVQPEWLREGADKLTFRRMDLCAGYLTSCRIEQKDGKKILSAQVADGQCVALLGSVASGISELSLQMETDEISGRLLSMTLSFTTSAGADVNAVCVYEYSKQTVVCPE